MDQKTIETWLPKLCDAARDAGALEMKYYREGFETIEKNDGSPVTIADQEAEKIIIAALLEVAPDIPIVAEEEVAAGNIPDISGGIYWLVDPLDGTKQFVQRSGEFTVNIALMVNDEPVMGIVYAPAIDELFYGCGDKAYCEIKGNAPVEICTRAVPDEGLTVVASRSHSKNEKMQEFLKGKNVASTAFRGSSLKIVEIAAGRADLYPRFAPTSEWDIAAGHAVLNAAGGKITQLDGSKFGYGKAANKFLNPHFIVSGK